MTEQDEIQKLLDRWETLQETGKTCSVEELCKDTPQHVAELTRQIAALQAINDILTSNGDVLPCEARWCTATPLLAPEKLVE